MKQSEIVLCGALFWFLIYTSGMRCVMLMIIMPKSGGKGTTTGKKWVSYFDALRVVAALAVVFIHVSARRWSSQDISTVQWQASNFWDGIARWAVPIFIMISGALMLNPEKRFSMKKLYSKNILRLVIAFVSWSLCYLLFETIVLKNYRGKGWALRAFISGGYHMWFMYMIIGLYIATPVLRLIVRDEKMTEYFLIIGIVISYILPGIRTLCSGWGFATGNRIAEAVAADVGVVTGAMRFEFASGYVLYYVLGYWLYKNKTSKKMRIVYYILGVLGLVLTFYFGLKVSLASGKKSNIFEERSPWVLMQAMALFVFAKYHLERFGQRKLVKVIAPLSFGIYLVHALMIEVLLTWVFRGIELNYFTIPLVAFSTFAASVLIIWPISKIPVVGKYVV